MVLFYTLPRIFSPIHRTSAGLNEMMINVDTIVRWKSQPNAAYATSPTMPGMTSAHTAYIAVNAKKQCYSDAKNPTTWWLMFLAMIQLYLSEVKLSPS
jgi:hypothetical protein